MTRIKSKLVLKSMTNNMFEIVKTVNTLEYGVPGDTLTRESVDTLLKSYIRRIKGNAFTVEFINGKD